MYRVNPAVRRNVCLLVLFVLMVPALPLAAAEAAPALPRPVKQSVPAGLPSPASEQQRGYLPGSSSSISLTGLPVSPDWTVEGDDEGAGFGSTIATAGDVNCDGFDDVIVGAPWYGVSRGRAYVYYGSPGGPSTAPDWTADGEEDGAGFGHSVSTAGDVNGDGCADVIVGASDSGKAYVYYGSDEGLSTSPNWIVEGEPGGLAFGFSVGTAGNVNGDVNPGTQLGLDDVIVGDPWYNTNWGKAYVYYGSVSDPSETPAWTAESDQSDAWFGWSVGTAGDVNGDGYGDVIVGANLYDSGGVVNAGKAYAYYGSASGLSTAPNWTVEGDQSYNEVGYSVGTAGNVNGDVNPLSGHGLDDVVVGVPGHKNGGQYVGQVNAYYGSTSGLTSPNWTVDGQGGSFGHSVGTAGDVNGDGYADVIVGAPYYGPTEIGAAYVYQGSISGLDTSAAWTFVSDQDYSGLGTSVGTAGDVNGDFGGDVIVGASGYDGGAVDGGKVYGFLGEGPLLHMHIEVQPVHDLGLNDSGWYEPNPLIFTMVIDSAVEGSIDNPTFRINGSDRLRAIPTEHPSLGRWTGQHWLCWSGSCREDLTVWPISVGENRINWVIWVQPQVDTTLIGQMSFSWQGSTFVDTDSVHVPKAEIAPVIIIPGLMGTWPPSRSGGLIFLVYTPLIRYLQESIGYKEGESLFTFPYDWRLPTDNAGPELAGEITRIKGLTKPTYVVSSRVDIVAHSMGGLVARDYLERSVRDDVGNLITLATPHRGAPYAYPVWEGGEFSWWLTYLMACGRFSCTPQEVFDYVHSQVPSLQELLPTEDVVDEEAYLVDGDGHTYPYGRPDNPLVNDLNDNDEDDPYEVGNLIDTPGLSVWAFYGLGYYTTVSYKVTLPQLNMWEHGRAIGSTFGAGDGTVPEYSARISTIDGLGGLAGHERTFEGEEARVDHDYIPTAAAVMQWAARVLTGADNVPKLQAGPQVLSQQGQGLGLSFAAVGPVNFLVTDPQGRRVGVDPATGQVVQEIPETYYFGPNEVFEGKEIEAISIYAPLAGDYSLQVVGAGEGHFDFAVMFTSLQGQEELLLRDEGETSVGQVREYTVPGEPQPPSERELVYTLPVMKEADDWSSVLRLQNPWEASTQGMNIVHDGDGNLKIGASSLKRLEPHTVLSIPFAEELSLPDEFWGSAFFDGQDGQMAALALTGATADLRRVASEGISRGASTLHVPYFPGGGISSVLYVQNTSDEQTTVRVTRRDLDGTSIPSASITMTIAPWATVRSSFQSELPVEFQGTATVESLGGQPLVGAVVLEKLSGEAALYSVADLPSAAIFVPQVLKGKYDVDTFLQIQNTAAAPARVVIHYYNADGQSVPRATEQVLIPAYGAAHVAQAANAALPAGFAGSAVVESSDGAPLAVVVVGISTNLQDIAGSSAFYGGSEVVALPDLTNVSGLPVIQVQNVGGSTANVVLRCYDGDGTPVYNTTVEIAPYGYASFYADMLPLPPDFQGSAVLESTNGQPLVAFTWLIGSPAGLSLYGGSGVGALVIPPASCAAAPAYANGAIDVTFATNAPSAGIAYTELWAHTPSAGWSNTGLTAPGMSGQFSYTPGQGEGAYSFATVAVDGAGNREATPNGSGDATTLYDTTAPSSQVEALPLYTSATPFRVRWSGSDNLSGIDHYDVFVADESTAVWVSWLSSVTSTESLFAGVRGHTYHFCSEAADHAGNHEHCRLICPGGSCWPIVSDAHTSVVPGSRVNDLPPVSGNRTFTVSWSGSPGAQGYDVAVRDGLTGSWRTWKSNVPYTSASYTGEWGHTYYFRSRARQGTTWELWPYDYDTYTKLISPSDVGATTPPASGRTFLATRCSPVLAWTAWPTTWRSW